MIRLNRAVRVAILFVPVLLWDAVYFLVKELYNVMSDLDDLIEKKSTEFTNRGN